MHKAIDLYKEEKDLDDPGMQNEVNDLLMAAVEAARDYVQGLAEKNSTIRWDVPDLDKENIRSTKAARSAHNHVLLSSLSEPPAQ